VSIVLEKKQILVKLRSAYSVGSIMYKTPLISVLAFSGVKGPHAISLDQSTDCDVNIGDTHIRFVAANASFDDRDFTAPAPEEGSTIFFTGRPFLENQLISNCSGDSVLAASEFDGMYSLARISSGTLELQTDLLGCGPVYYSRSGENLFFASHLGLLVDILPVKPALNSLGVASQLFARYQLFDETHFSGTFRLPSGSKLIASSDGNGAVDIRIEQLNALENLIETPHESFDPDSLRQMLSQSNNREGFTHRSALMLSGGRDSLALALTCNSQLKTAFTYGERHSHDFQRARKRASDLAISFQPVPYDRWSLNSFHDTIIGVHGGCSGLQTAHNIVGYDFAQSKGADVAVVGFLGDALTGAHHGPSGKPDIKRVLKVLLSQNAASHAAREYPEEREYICDHIISQYENLAKQTTPSAALMLLDLRFRQARWIGMMFNLCSWHLPVAVPFFCEAIIRRSLNARPEQLAGQQIYDKLLETELTRRNLQMNPRGGMRVRIQSWMELFFRREKQVVRLSWPGVIQRTNLDINTFLCGDARLDSVTRKSWNAVQTGVMEDVIEFCSSAPIGAKARGFAAPFK
jgi:hypothetical protein